MEQLGKDDAELYHQGTANPVCPLCARITLVARSFSCASFVINARVDRKRVSGFAREYGKVQGLPKKVQLQLWIPGFLSGRGGMQRPKSAGGPAKDYRSIGFGTV